MGLYYYSLGRNKKLWYNSSGVYVCSAAKEELDKADDRHIAAMRFEKDHWKVHLYVGDTLTTVIDKEDRELPNGDRERVVTTLYQKITKGRTDLVCHCGASYVWLGYAVWTEEIKKKPDRLMDTPLGRVEFGGESKRSALRHFKTQKARTAYINKQLEAKNARA